MAESITVTLSRFFKFSTNPPGSRYLRWSESPGELLPVSYFAENTSETNRLLSVVRMYDDGRVTLFVPRSSGQPTILASIQQELRIRFSATAGSTTYTLAVTGLPGAATSPIEWTPDNSPEVIAFYNAVPAQGVSALSIAFDSPEDLAIEAGVGGAVMAAAAANAELTSPDLADIDAGIGAGPMGALGAGGQIRPPIKQIDADIGAGPMGALGAGGQIRPPIKQIDAGIGAGPMGALGGHVVRRETTPPSAPQNIVAAQITQDITVLEWDEPDSDGFTDITGYEIQFVGSGWISTGMDTRRVYRLTQIGSMQLRAGQTYRIRIRARNAAGAGTSSDVFSFTTAAVQKATAPMFLHTESVSRSHVELVWRQPADVGGGEISRYEVATILPNGEIPVFEPTDDDSTRWIIRGLGDGYTYGFRIRAVNEAGAGEISKPIYARTADSVTTPIISEQRISLLDDTYRQSLIVRLDDIDCRLSVWWQPLDSAWYGSLEIPVNTPIAQARRLAVNAGILDRAVAPISGNIVCRALDSADARSEPGISAWSTPTHALFYEQ